MSSKQQHWQSAEQMQQSDSAESSLESSLDWLSAAIDEQGLSEQQLGRLLHDEQLQQQYERYHLIGAAIRQELPKQVQVDFSVDFAARLQQEAVHQLQPHGSILQRLGHRFKAAANSDWFKPTAQTAIAASVALMAVVGVQHYQQPFEQELMSPLPVLQTLPVAGFATPVSLSQTTVDTRLEQHAHQAMLEQQRRLQELLNAHHQQVRVLEQAALLNEQSQPAVDVEPDGNN
ncbi:RseA family anti-sigma factor [Alkalimonas sp.]|uniref:sigma-E factor negative regulatory protein n=1 Tax=Alkalimonas sp. TaxID=1872453 RepID=UPI00263A9B90|nr:RseA family anti-sigma factor [Alkalimonas sp.]